jgi:hypothetical protein
MLIPLNLAVAMGDLDEAHSALQDATRHTALVPKMRRERIVEAAHPLCGQGLPGYIPGLGHGVLQPEGEFEGIAPRPRGEMEMRRCKGLGMIPHPAWR